jgi:hypothetical protein
MLQSSTGIFVQQGKKKENYCVQKVNAVFSFKPDLIVCVVIPRVIRQPRSFSSVATAAA